MPKEVGRLTTKPFWIILIAIVYAFLDEQLIALFPSSLSAFVSHPCNHFVGGFVKIFNGSSVSTFVGSSMSNKAPFPAPAHSGFK